MSTLSTTELRNEIAKQPKACAKKLAVKYGLTTKQIAGIRRSITCEKLKLEKEIAEFKANEKKIKKAEKLATNGGDFGNYNGASKNEAREKMQTKIVSSKPSGKILTLCADKCLIEEPIHAVDSNRFTFLGVEYNEEVYRRLQKHLAKSTLKMDTYNGKLGDVLERSKANDFAHIVMDYCGQLATFADDIITAVQNNLVVVGGSIYITLNLRANVYHLDFYNEILGLSSITKEELEKGQYLKTVIDSFLKRLCGFNYSFEKPFFYRDTLEDGRKLGANMVLLTITRLK